MYVFLPQQHRSFPAKAWSLQCHPELLQTVTALELQAAQSGYIESKSSHVISPEGYAYTLVTAGVVYTISEDYIMILSTFRMLWQCRRWLFWKLIHTNQIISQGYAHQEHVTWNFELTNQQKTGGNRTNFMFIQLLLWYCIQQQHVLTDWLVYIGVGRCTVLEVINQVQTVCVAFIHMQHH